MTVCVTKVFDGIEVPYTFTGVDQLIEDFIAAVPFRELSETRWEIVRATQGKGELSVRELARVVGRDVKRVHEDAVVLAELGMPERIGSGGVICPYSSMHVDMKMKAA